jgi:hypothetical protein
VHLARAWSDNQCFTFLVRQTVCRSVTDVKYSLPYFYVSD